MVGIMASSEPLNENSGNARSVEVGGPADVSMAVPEKGDRVIDLFYHYFEMIPVDTEELKREVYKLRYQVYCLETGFETVDNCKQEMDADGHPVYLEVDEFDERSVHCLILHKASNLYAATTRLILPSPDDVDAPFPIEVHCQLNERITGQEHRAQLGETSRYAISRDFKRRAGEAGTLAGVSDKTILRQDDGQRKSLPHLSMALVACLMRATRRNGIAYWYAVMEPALFRMLRRYGIFFREIGPGTDYHGLRVPCLINVDEMVASIAKTNRPVWELVTNDGELA